MYGRFTIGDSGQSKTVVIYGTLFLVADILHVSYVFDFQDHFACVEDYDALMR